MLLHSTSLRNPPDLLKSPRQHPPLAYFLRLNCLRSVAVEASLIFHPPHPFACCGEAKDVLVLSRKIGERILIGDKIAITVVKIGHGGVRIGIEAPTELAVVREELANELERTERALAAGDAETMVD
jgi:carbon storage regulator